MLRNVAIGGPMCSGKTELANALISDYGYTRVGFADRLKWLAQKTIGAGEPIRKDGVYNTFPLDRSVQTLSGRQALQHLGDSLKTLDRYMWVDWMLQDIDDGERGAGPFVVDDLRFVYEATTLKHRDWVTVLVDAPLEVRDKRYLTLYGRLPTDEERQHVSEREWEEINFDLTVSGVGLPKMEAEKVIASLANDVTPVAA